MVDDDFERLTQHVTALKLRLDSLGRTVVSLIESNLALKQQLDELSGKPSMERRVLFARRKWRVQR